MAFLLPDPPDLDDDPGPVTPDDSVVIVQLAEEYGCSPADMVRWLADAGGPEGAELPPPEGANRWLVTDDASAEWALNKLREAHDALSEAMAQADEYAAPLRAKLDKIAEWLEEASREPKATLEHMRALLERYAIARRQATGKASIRLPSGRLATFAGRTRVVAVDEDAAVAALDGTEAVVHPPPKLLVSKVRAVEGWYWWAESTEPGKVHHGVVAERSLVPEWVLGCERVPCLVTEDGELVPIAGLAYAEGETTAKVELA